MVITIGPVCSESAARWTEYAQAVLVEVMTGHDTLPDVDDGVLVAFEELLEEWAGVAATTTPFSWSVDIEPDEVTLLVSSFYGMVQGLAEAAEARGYAVSPPEGELFYQTLIGGLLDGLLAAGGPAAQLATQLRSTWPGLATS